MPGARAGPQYDVIRRMTKDVHQSTTQLTDAGPAMHVDLPGDDSTPIPALTIIYHPILRRIGERALLSELLAGRDAKISRTAPRFTPPHQNRAAALDDSRISRTPFRLRLLDDGGVALDPDQSRTKIVIDGNHVTAPWRVSVSELEHGVIIELGDRIALLLHLYTSSEERETGDLGLVGDSAQILRVREDIRRVAVLDVPVLIRGETGTGKELVASAIHQASVRRGRPLVSVNLAALPATLAAAELFGAVRGAFTGAARNQEGYFRRAHGGTLFLDEIGETSVDVQVMLLRALETGQIYALGAQRAEHVDVRLIAATDADLEAMVQHGHFRAPLLHRLAGYEIQMPPVRSRRDDVARLLIYFLGLDLAEGGETECLDRTESTPWLSMQQMVRLVRYDWPGNVRQLRNAARQIVIANRGRGEATLPGALVRQIEQPPAAALGGALPGAFLGTSAGPFLGTPAGASPGAFAGASPGPTRGALTDGLSAATAEHARRLAPPRRQPSDISEQELVEALREHRWNIRATAVALRIPRTSLYRLIESSPGLRTAGDLDPDEIRACHSATHGNLDAMVERLCVSKKALRRRIKELSLA
jgi:DNA-binding NtrC family response regulator